MKSIYQYISLVFIFLLLSCSKDKLPNIEENIGDKYWRLVSKKYQEEDIAVYGQERDFYFEFRKKSEDFTLQSYTVNDQVYWIDYETDEIERTITIDNWFYNTSYKKSESKFLKELLMDRYSTWKVDLVTEKDMVLSFTRNDSLLELYFMADKILYAEWK